MEDMIRDLGLQYAKSLPLAIGSVLVPLILAGWLAYKAKDLDENLRSPAWVVLGVLSFMFVVQAPAAYQQAKNDCRTLWASSGGQQLFRSPSWEYKLAGCDKIWPYGPDFGQG